MNTVVEVYTAFNTLKDMLGDRKLQDDRAFMDRISFDEIQALLSARSVFTIDNPSSLRIIFHMGKFKTADVRKLFEDPFDLFILVTREKLSSVNMKQIAEMDKAIDAFELGELLFNVSKHQLVPKHEPITDPEEIKDILEKYRVKTRHQLPLILKTDPMARYLGIRPGQLVKITRSSPGAGEYVLYRCCV